MKFGEHFFDIKNMRTAHGWRRKIHSFHTVHSKTCH